MTSSDSNASRRRSVQIDLADRLHSAAIHLLRQLRREDDATGISGPRLSALSVVIFAGPLTLGDLARAEQVRPPTMSRIIDGLEANGFVERQPHPSDRRAVLLRATRRGRKLLQAGRRRRLSVLAGRLERLKPEEREHLARALSILEAMLGLKPCQRQVPTSNPNS